MPWREADRQVDGENAWQSGCWIWTGYTDQRGRPMLRNKVSNRLASTVLWERENGPAPEGMVLGSLCGEQVCVRATHREPMTRRELSYKTRWMRLNRPRRLRAYVLRVQGWSNREIADHFGVDEATIRRALRWS